MTTTPSAPSTDLHMAIDEKDVAWAAVPSAPGPQPLNLHDEEKTDAPSISAATSLVVTWDGPTDPTNPKNWPRHRKWIVALLVSLGGLVTLMSGAMMAPAINEICRDLGVSVNEAQLSLSIYIFAFAFGPLLWGPCSEVFGRKPVWIVGSLFYLLWNTVCGFARSNGLMIAARFLSGFSASAEFAIYPAVVADCWAAEERGTAFALSNFLPLLGPALGPLVAGVVTNALAWPWLFWVLTIFAAILTLATFFFFPETYEPVLLSKKADKLRKSTGQDYVTELEAQGARQPLSEKLRTGLTRPFRMIYKEPILQVMSFLLAVNFGILYFVLSTFASLWIDVYHQTVGESGLHYMAIAIGYTLAAQGGGRATDRIWAKMKANRGGEAAPEYRVPLMVPGVLLLPAGLLLYGWSAHFVLHWAITDLGAVIYGFGIIIGTQAMQNYVIDSFPQFTASAVAAVQFLRMTFAFVFPIFAPTMYSALGYGWGNTVLAGSVLALGLPGPLLLWKYGARLRARGIVHR